MSCFLSAQFASPGYDASLEDSSFSIRKAYPEFWKGSLRPSAYKTHVDLGGSVARGVKRQCGGQNRRFLVISVVILSEPLELKPILLIYYAVS